MRTRLGRAGLALVFGLSGAALAGPGAAGRRAVVATPEHRSDRTAQAVVRQASRILEPLLGAAEPASVELEADEDRFFARADRADEPDATAFADFDGNALIALDLDVDEARGRILAHEAAALHARAALGARLPPWLEEGLACCVEDAWAQGEELGQERPDPDRTARARLEVRSRSSVTRLLALDAPDFERGERVHRDVALAWAAVRRLLRAPRGERALVAAFEELRATGSAGRAQTALLAVYPASELLPRR